MEPFEKSLCSVRRCMEGDGTEHLDPVMKILIGLCLLAAFGRPTYGGNPGAPSTVPYVRGQYQVPSLPPPTPATPPMVAPLSRAPIPTPVPLPPSHAKFMYVPPKAAHSPAPQAQGKLNKTLKDTFERTNAVFKKNDEPRTRDSDPQIEEGFLFFRPSSAPSPTPKSQDPGRASTIESPEEQSVPEVGPSDPQPTREQQKDQGPPGSIRPPPPSESSPSPDGNGWGPGQTDSSDSQEKRRDLAFVLKWAKAILEQSYKDGLEAIQKRWDEIGFGKKVHEWAHPEDPPNQPPNPPPPPPQQTPPPNQNGW
jgi:hypothetical protein